jgi:hypothetical protein
VNDIVTPVPKVDPSASSVHVYEQGVAGHVDEDPAKETAEPVTGEEGLYTKAGTGGGVEVIPGVDADTTTLCSTLADCERASIIVRRTYLVPPL